MEFVAAFVLYELLVAYAYTATPWNSNPILACSATGTQSSHVATHLIVSAFTALPALIAPLLLRRQRDRKRRALGTSSAAVALGVAALLAALLGTLAAHFAYGLGAPACGRSTMTDARLGSTDAVYSIFAPPHAARESALDICAERCCADARCARFMVTTTAHSKSVHCAQGEPCCWLEAAGGEEALQRCDRNSTVGMPVRGDRSTSSSTAAFPPARLIFARITDVGYTTALAASVVSGAAWTPRDGGPSAASRASCDASWGNPYARGCAIDAQWGGGKVRDGICAARSGDECGGCASFLRWTDAGYAFDGFKYGPVTLAFYWAASALLYPSAAWGAAWGSGGILLGNALLLPVLLLAVGVLAARLSPREEAAMRTLGRALFAALLVAAMWPLLPHELLRQGVIDALPLTLGLFALIAAADAQNFRAGLLAGLSTSAKIFPGAALLLTCSPIRAGAQGGGVARAWRAYALGVVCGAVPFAPFVRSYDGVVGVLSNLVLFPLVRPADATAWHCGVPHAGLLKGALTLSTLVALALWARRRAALPSGFHAPERTACTTVICSLLALSAPGNHANYWLPGLCLLAALLAAAGRGEVVVETEEELKKVL